MSNRESRGDTNEFYRGVVFGNEESYSTWAGFLAGAFLYGKNKRD